jgi:hypothetical protein
MPELKEVREAAELLYGRERGEPLMNGGVLRPAR